MAAEGRYATAGRRKILEILKENSDHTITAAEVSNRLKELGSEVNITTVYRNLDKLEQDGTVMRYTSQAGGQAGYQYVGQDNNCCGHLHLKCVHCGKIWHLNCEFMSEISEHIQKEHGFTIQCKNSIIYGVCQDCGKTEKIEDIPKNT